MSTVELQGFKHLLGNISSEENILDKQTGVYQITFLPTEMLRPGKYQPRTVFDDDSLMELSKSIESNGIIQPLVVRSIFENDQKFYEIILGERRWRAAKLAGLKKVPVIIQELKDDMALIFGLIENVQRQDLNSMDRAVALSRLKNEFSITHEKVAEVVGLSRSAVTNFIRLLSLPDEIQQLIKEGDLGAGHAKALIALDKDSQLKIAYEIVKKRLSARGAEELVQKMKLSSLSKKQNGTLFDEDKLNQWSSILSKRIASPVQVHLNQRGQGRVVIKIESLEDLQKLMGYFI